MIPLKVESWIWWTLIIICIICRMISRVQTVGSLRRFQADDYITLVAIAFYTVLVVTINIVAHEDSNLLPPGFDVSSLTPDEIKGRQYGSKLVIVVEQSQCVAVWCEKVCLLLLYRRLTVGTKERIAIKILLGYAIGSFVLMEILYLGVWCRPFTMYWAVPTTTQCSAATNHLITNAVFNISSDVFILAVALPMFIKTKLPLKKKLAVVGIFSLGSFVIVAAILNKAYSFTQPFGADWTFWYVRESSTAILTANAAFVWAFLRRMFNLHSLGGSSGGRGYSNGYVPTYTGNTNNTNTQSRIDTLRKKRPNHQELEIDMDFLVPDAERGIHREIEIQVTQDSRRTSTSTKNPDSFDSATKPSWPDAWHLKQSESKDGLVGNDVRVNDFGGMRSPNESPPRMPAPVALKRNSNGSDPRV